MKSQAGISILIPNFNGLGLLEENLPYALKAAENSGVKCEIVVADDASSDQSCAFVEREYPQIKLIRGDINLGFAGNCNRGAGYCQNEWILLLNSDVKLHPDYLRLLLPFTHDQRVFGLSGSIWPDGPGPMMDAGKFPCWKGLMLNTTTNFQAKPDAGNTFPSLFLSGAASLLNAEKFRELCGFQELFNPYYFEDAEIAIHAWRRGWSSLFVQEAKCFHRISSTIANTSKRETVKMVARRNKFLLHEIHLGGFRRFLWKISMVFYRLMAFVNPSSVSSKAYYEYRLRQEKALTIRKKIDAYPGMLSLSHVVRQIQAELKGKTGTLF